jgi:hypothetical protein
MGLSNTMMALNTSIRNLNARKLMVVFSLAVSLLLVSSRSFACSCAAFPADEAEAVAIAYGRADVVFVGIVTSVKKRFQLPLPVRDATFDVSQAWKGVSEFDGTVVRSAIGEIACGYKFRKGSSYLVFANWVPDQGVLWTNMCELTREESKAETLIKELDGINLRTEPDSQEIEKTPSDRP